MPQRRYISPAASDSRKVARLAKMPEGGTAVALWTLLLPWVDDGSLMEAEPEDVRTRVVPRWSHLRDEDVQQLLLMMHQVGLITLYRVEGLQYLRFENFYQFQTYIKQENRGSTLPGPEQGEVLTREVSVCNPVERSAAPQDGEQLHNAEHDSPSRTRASGSDSGSDSDSDSFRLRECRPAARGTAPVGGEKPQRRRKADADPRVQPTLAYWGERFHAEMERDYPAVFGRDGAAIRGLPKSYGIEELRALIDAYFASDDRLIRGSTPDIANFVRLIPRLISLATNGESHAPPGTFDPHWALKQMARRTGEVPEIDSG